MGRNTGYKKVIFIDDDKEMVKTYSSILERKELSEFLICFDNAIDGLNYLKEKKQTELPSYILLDLYMPQMSGFEFLKRIAKMGTLKDSIEIFVCTSSTKKDDRNKVMNYPFVSAYLEKPLTGDFLELLIRDKIW